MFATLLSVNYRKIVYLLHASSIYGIVLQKYEIFAYCTKIVIHSQRSCP